MWWLFQSVIIAVRQLLALKQHYAGKLRNPSLTTQHHNAFDRSDCLHGRAVWLP